MTDLVTYDDAAAMLGISADAVRQRAKRGRWQRVRGNDGKARVRLPDDLERPDATGRDRTAGPDATPGRPDDVAARLAEALAQVALLREMVADLRDDRDRWRGMAERLAERRQATSDSVSAAIAGMRAAAAKA